MKLYLVRHGQSQANLERVVQGTMDSPLTELGKRQAIELRTQLPDKWDHVYMSPLSRARDTGLLVTQLPADDQKISYHQELMEIDFGLLQGTPYNEVPFTREEIRSHIHFHKDVFQGRYNAEPVAQFLNRTHTMFEQMISEITTNDWKKVIVFTHGGVLRSISQHYLNLSDQRWDNCEYGILERVDDKWHLDRFTAHIITQD